MNIGFKSVVHHGWKLARIYKGDVACPYPEGSQAATEFALGVGRAKRGEPWEGFVKVKRERKVRGAADA